jgi:hypothetical protein
MITEASRGMAADIREDGQVTTTAGPRPGTPAMWWGVIGVGLLFASASFRLGARGLHTIGAGLSPGQWLLLVLLTIAFVYGEGIRALQRKYVPHVMTRIELLRGERRPWYRLLAPLHAMSLIGAPTRILLRAWAGVFAIVAAVVIVRSFPEPWRGITGFAVAAALAWGATALIRTALRSFR